MDFPHQGMQSWVNPHGIRILRLHYSADPEKTPEWAAKQRSAMTNQADYQQEFEINFAAKQGTLIYQLHEEATLENSFEIPHTWTRYFGLDPHPVVPHAALWLAVDHWGDVWAYRELWPSRLYAQRGNQPEDDNRYSIKQFCETFNWLESEENPENGGKSEDIYKRVIDYAARAMGQGFFDDKPEYNFQKRYEDLTGWRFEDCIKDTGTAIDTVNQLLRPRDVEQPDGSFKPKSKLHIFQDKCPELVHELKTNRFQQLTPLMAERSDPTGKPQDKRKHMTDNLNYLAMSGLEYIPKVTLRSTWKPINQAVNY